jgi:hypothetical protein
MAGELHALPGGMRRGGGRGRRVFGGIHSVHLNKG